MEDWTQEEIDIITSDYFSMLIDELEGRPYNKSQHRRLIKPFLPNRTESSIEFKHQNISATLVELGTPYIKGYKPADNYQGLLLRSVSIYLLAHPELEVLFQKFAEVPVSKTTSVLSFDTILDTRPDKKFIANEPILPYGNLAVKLNYLEMEQGNRAIGYSGEQIVMDYERWRLIKENKESLADSIEWVAQTQGDGLGYDILSKNKNGTDRYIEVKSTKLTKEAPIFFSKNEYQFSLNNSTNYHLYRVFNLNQDPKLFIVDGRFDDFCRYEAIKYKGFF